MSHQKKVLVVDDRSEMLEFLRSTLGLSSQDCELQAVPSAEEGLLEIRQTAFDLLITEVRLPGMSGFDLVRRTRTLRPELPAIMVADYSSEQGQQEAADLGVKHYFQKPLDIDSVSAAVHMALFGDLVVYADNPDVPEPAEIAIPNKAQERLETLRTDTAATRIVLAAASGRVLFQVGRGQGIDLPKLTTLIAQNLANSARIAQELSEMTLNTIQYHAGSEVELYIASGGRDYFLAIFFDAQAKRGRMGTIWVFAQRAIKDLLPILPVLSAANPQVASSATLEVTAVEQVDRPLQPAFPTEPEMQPDTRNNTPPFIEKTDTTPNYVNSELDAQSELLAPTEAEGFFILDESTTQDSSDLDAFWESAASDSPAVTDTRGAFTFEQAQHQGLIPGNREPTPEVPVIQSDDVPESVPADISELFAQEYDAANSAELDDFWGEALAEHGAGPETTGLSFSEAMRQGLIPDEIELGGGAGAAADLNEEADEKK